MDFGWLSGCVGQGATAVAILPTKRFLASLACAVPCRWYIYSVASVASVASE